MQVWTEDIGRVSGLGAAKLRVLRKAGFETVGDLLSFFPRDYYVSGETPAIVPGETAVLLGSLAASPTQVQVRRGLVILSARFRHDGVSTPCVWYNQPWLRRQLEPGKLYLFLGEVQESRGSKQLVNPTAEPWEGELPDCLSLYRPPKGVSAATLREAIRMALEYAHGRIEDPLPGSLIRDLDLPCREEAVRSLHLPSSRKEAERAAKRMALEELLFFLLMTSSGRRERMIRSAPVLARGESLKKIEARLPYALTGAQMRTLDEIDRDLTSGHPMNRMVQGDVGSGKTVVALAASYQAIANGCQAIYMAPTELLANQLYEEAVKLLGPLGVVCGYLSGSLTAAGRRDILRGASDGSIQLLVGTHALIQKGVEFRNPGLVITDEQHRFGVRQRQELLQKGQEMHALVMSATPVPRSLSLVLYGDLDLSIMNEMPPGRKPVITRIVPQERRDDLYRYVAEEAKQGRQTYVVCPAIDDAPEGYAMQSASSLFRELTQGPLRSVPAALVHGRQSAAERMETLQAFRDGTIRVLVSTTVIEVGIHASAASVIVIENAERFGLAQLHQLRGRVGRAGQQAYCFLLSPQGRENPRLAAMCRSTDGFAIAEEDLRLRGPGEVLGTRQSGTMDPRILRLLRDESLLKTAQDTVDRLLKAPDGDETADKMLCEARARFRRIADDIAMN